MILNEKLFNYETEIVSVKSMSNEVARRIRSFKVSIRFNRNTYGSVIINYLLLTIIFVFDPLAIALVIAANFAFAQLQTCNKRKSLW